MLRDQCWRTLALQPIMSHLFRLHCILIRPTLNYYYKRHAKRSGIFLRAFYFVSVMTWSPDCHLRGTCLSFSIPTGCLSKICPASFCIRREVNLGFWPLLDEFHDTRALACFLFYLWALSWPGFVFTPAVQSFLWDTLPPCGIKL